MFPMFVSDSCMNNM